MADSVFFKSQVGAEPKKSFDFGGFFKNVVARNEDTWTEAEAFLFIIVAAASCDGHVSPEESEQILSTIHRSQLFKQANAEELRRINNAVSDRLDRRGEHALAEACGTLPEKYRLAAFAQAVDIVLSDGGFVQAEASFLDRLMELLHIDDASAAKIAEVMNIKNGC